MNKRILIVSALAAILYLFSEFVWAADPTAIQVNDQIQDQEQIYGNQLLTPTERLEYRAQMQAAKTVEERQQIFNEHHQAMNERAASRGMVLPDESRSRGTGMGQGRGMGSGGMGYGSGSGGMMGYGSGSGGSGSGGGGSGGGGSGGGGSGAGGSGGGGGR